MTGRISFQSSDSRTSPRYALMELGSFIRTERMQDSIHQYLNVTNVSERYQVSTATIWRWSREGGLPLPIKLNGTTRWRLSDLRTWEARQTDKTVNTIQPHL